MRDWKKAFGQPDDAFTLRVQQTLLAIEEKEEEPVKKKMTLSLAFACILFVTVLAVSAVAASNLLGGQPDPTLTPLSQGGEDGSGLTDEPTPIPTAMPTPTPLPAATTVPPELQPTPMPYWTQPYADYYHVDEHCSGMEDAQRVSFETAVNMGKQPCPICVVEYFRVQEMEQAAEPTLPPEPMPTPTPMPPLPCWTTPNGAYWHMDEHCSGMVGAVSVSRDEAEQAGKMSCPICVEEYFRALEVDMALAADAALAANPTLPPESLPVQPDDGADGEGIALMTDFNQPLRTGEARGWGIDLTDPNRDDFNAGSEPLNGEYNGVWTNDILTVHNMVFLKTRSAIFMEFEYSMNDNAVSPWSIRITPFMEGETGPLGWHDARVHEVSGEDNTIRYLLSVVTDSPVDFPNITNLWGVYGGAAAEEQRLLGSLGNNLEWGRQYKE